MQWSWNYVSFTILATIPEHFEVVPLLRNCYVRGYRTTSKFTQNYLKDSIGNFCYFELCSKFPYETLKLYYSELPQRFHRKHRNFSKTKKYLNFCYTKSFIFICDFSPVTVIFNFNLWLNLIRCFECYSFVT